MSCDECFLFCQKIAELKGENVDYYTLAYHAQKICRSRHYYRQSIPISIQTSKNLDSLSKSPPIST